MEYIFEPDITGAEEHIALWETCFPGDGDFSRRFFSAGMAASAVKALDSAGKLVGQILLVPCTVRGENDKPAFYGYAVCTDPEYRGRGVCRRMHEKLFSEHPGINYFVRPAEDLLVNYYAGLGMRVMNRVMSLTFIAANSKVDVWRADAAKYGLIRREYLSPGRYVDFSDMKLEFILRENEAAGGGTYFTESCGEVCAVFGHREGDILFAEEWLAPDALCGITAAGAAAAATGAKRFSVRFVVPPDRGGALNDELLAAYPELSAVSETIGAAFRKSLDNAVLSISVGSMGVGSDIGYTNLYME